MNHAAPARKPLAALALAAAVAAFPVVRGGTDETQEPRERYSLEVDGRAVDLAVDVPFELTLGDETVSAILRRAPTRVLAAAGVAFEYPRGMTFEYEGDSSSRTWTLDGNDAVLMFFEFTVALELEEFVESQVEAYETLGDVERRPAQIELGTEQVDGAWLGVGSELFALAVEVFPVPGGEGRQWLVLQDSCDALDESTEEYAELRALLGSTFRSTR